MLIDRLPTTKGHLRHGVTPDVLACWSGVSRSTITRTIGEVRLLLAERGCTLEGGLRLPTLADGVTHLGTSGLLGLLEATDVRVRRPAVLKAGRQRFVSGKARANTVKAPVITDVAGRLLCCGQPRSGSIHDRTRAGLVERLTPTPGVTLLADAGYKGLSAQTACAVITPRPARRKTSCRCAPPSPPRTRPNAELTRPSGSASRTASAI